MLRDHKEVDDTGTLGRKIGLGDPGDPYSLARFGKLAVGARFKDGDNIPDQVDNSPPGRKSEDEGYTEQMRMFHILWIRYGRLEQRETLGGAPVSTEVRELYRQVNIRRMRLIQEFVDWKRTNSEAALHELQLANIALNNPMPAVKDLNLTLYVMSLLHTGVYELMEDHTLRPEHLPGDPLMRHRAAEQIHFYKRFLERVALKLRKAL